MNVRHLTHLRPLVLTAAVLIALMIPACAEFLVSEQNQSKLHRWRPGVAPSLWHSQRCNDGDYNVSEGSADGWLAEHVQDMWSKFTPGSGSGLTGTFGPTPYAFPKHITVFNGEIIVMSSNDATIWRYDLGGSSVGTYPSGLSIGMGTATNGTDLFACFWDGATTQIREYTSGFALTRTHAIPSGLGGANCIFDLAYDRATGNFFGLARSGYSVTSDMVYEFTMGGAVVASYQLPFQADGIGQFDPGAQVLSVDTAPTLVAPGQNSIPVTVEVRNAHPTEALDINRILLRYTGSADRSNEYLSVPDPANPTTIAAGATESFAFLVEVKVTATLETITLDAGIDAVTALSMTPILVIGADTKDTWDVVGAFPQIRTVAAAPTLVAPGTTGHVITMTVENVGLNGLDVNQASLSFAHQGGMVVTSEYTVVADPANPTTIAPGVTGAFFFTVGVSPAATLGIVNLDAKVTATDQVTAGILTDVGADVPDSWEVVTSFVLVREVAAADSDVVQGGSGYAVNITVENPSPVSVLVSVLTLTFTGTADRTSQYTVMADMGNPALIAAGVTESFDFSVDVDMAATTELVTLDAVFSGVDTGGGFSVIDVDADITDQWTVGICSVSLCGDCNGDMVVSILDALAAAQHASGLLTLAGPAFTACNVLGDLEPLPTAMVSIVDALTIAQFSAGLPVGLACC